VGFGTFVDKGVLPFSLSTNEVINRWVHAAADDTRYHLDIMSDREWLFEKISLN